MTPIFSTTKEYSDLSSTLYDRDFNLWVEVTAQLIREGRLSEIDAKNLLEEVEAMGRSEKHALSSNLVVILLHLLKWQYQPDHRTRSWELSIAEHRRRLVEIIEASPSLQNYYQEEVFSQCYRHARKQARIETGLPLENFPEAPLFSPTQVMNEEFLPD